MVKYTVFSNKYDVLYQIVVLKEKDKEKYRWINLTREHICSYVFNSHNEALEDLLRFEEDGKIRILEKTNLTF